MWMLTPRGFFSAVEKPDDRADGMVTVRARSKKDLSNLKDLLPDAQFNAPQAVWADYPCRLRCTKEDWANAVAEMAREIDYSNFKDEVKYQQGQKRASIYSRVWGVLLDIEGTRKWSSRYSSFDDGWSTQAWGSESRDIDNNDDLLGLSGQDLDDAIDARDTLPGAAVEDAFAKKEAAGKIAAPSQRKKKQAKGQATRRRAPRGRSR